MISFFVAGIPQPKGSSKIARIKLKVGFRYAVTSTTKGLPAWSKAIWAEAQRVKPPVPLQGPIAVRLTFYLPKPKRCDRLLPCVRPDIDKLVRGFL